MAPLWYVFCIFRIILSQYDMQSLGVKEMEDIEVEDALYPSKTVSPQMKNQRIRDKCKQFGKDDEFPEGDRGPTCMTRFRVRLMR